MEYKPYLARLFGKRLDSPLILENKSKEELLLLPFIALNIDLGHVITIRNIYKEALYLDKRYADIDIIQLAIPLLINKLRSDVLCSVYGTADFYDRILIFMSILERIYDILTLIKSKIFLYTDPVDFLQNEVDALSDSINLFCNYYNIEYDNLVKEIRNHE